MLGYQSLRRSIMIHSINIRKDITQLNKKEFMNEEIAAICVKCKKARNNLSYKEATTEYCGSLCCDVNLKEFYSLRKVINLLTWNYRFRLFALRTWFLERNNFTYGSHRNDLNVVGHYTQMVWAASHKVGCGLAKCSSGGPKNKPFFNYVCNYCPM